MTSPKPTVFPVRRCRLGNYEQSNQCDGSRKLNESNPASTETAEGGMMLGHHHANKRRPQNFKRKNPCANGRARPCANGRAPTTQ
jgi:hypothetical protein